MCKTRTKVFVVIQGENDGYHLWSLVDGGKVFHFKNESFFILSAKLFYDQFILKHAYCWKAFGTKVAILHKGPQIY